MRQHRRGQQYIVQGPTQTN